MVLGLRERWLVIRKRCSVQVYLGYMLLHGTHANTEDLVWNRLVIFGLWWHGLPSAQILMSYIGLTWYWPILLCYSRNFQTTCSLICCSVKGAQEFHLVTSFCHRCLTLWIRGWLSHLYFRWQWGERKDRQNVVSKFYGQDSPGESALAHIPYTDFSSFKIS